MNLYYSPGACSLADHIALHEAGISFECEKVDLKTKRTDTGVDFTTINPKGYVPALTLDSGETTRTAGYSKGMATFTITKGGAMYAAARRSKIFL